MFDSLGPRREEFVDGDLGTGPFRSLVVIEDDHAPWGQVVVEEVEAFLVGLVDVAVEMNKAELGIGKPR